MLTVLPVLLLLTAALAPGDRSLDLLPTPWPVDGLERDLSPRTFGDAPVFVRIDLGASEGRSAPLVEGFETFTILGSRGTGRASLHDVQKTCEFLCGDEGETCHYVARVVLHRSLDEIGTPLAALPGDVAVKGFRPGSAERVDGPEAWPTGVRAEPAWSPYDDVVPEYVLVAVEAAGAGIGLETRWYGRTSMIEGRDCGLSRYGALELVACSEFAAILSGRRPLLVSVADYNIAVAEPVASFESGGDTYHVVRLGLKAQTAYGLLVETADGWRGLFRPRDYPVLC